MQKEHQLILIPIPHDTVQFPCLFMGSPQLGLRWTDHKVKMDGAIYYHLYICSNEEIKEGDWYIYDRTSVIQANGLVGFHASVKDRCLKIIATTDSSLKMDTCDITYVKSENTKNHFKRELPTISKSFIEKYISSYNKGNIIQSVIIEYDYKIINNPDNVGLLKATIPKLNINEIIIAEEYNNFSYNDMLQFYIDNTDWSEQDAKEILDIWLKEEYHKYK